MNTILGIFVLANQSAHCTGHGHRYFIEYMSEQSHPKSAYLIEAGCGRIIENVVRFAVEAVDEVSRRVGDQFLIHGLAQAFKARDGIKQKACFGPCSVTEALKRASPNAQERLHRLQRAVPVLQHQVRAQAQGCVCHVSEVCSYIVHEASFLQLWMCILFVYLPAKELFCFNTKCVQKTARRNQCN
jgi:hypothetical protein